MAQKDDYVLVRLDFSEYKHAAQAGFDRHCLSLNRSGSEGLQGDGWKSDIEGAVGEYVAHKALGVHWVPVHKYYPEAVKPKLRFVTKTVDGWHKRLLIPRNTDDLTNYVLVVGETTVKRAEGPPVWRYLDFWVLGWMNGGEAKREFELDTVSLIRPAYAIDKEFLRPLSDLKL